MFLNYIYFYTLTLKYIIVPSGGRGIAFVSFADVEVCTAAAAASIEISFLKQRSLIPGV